MSDAGPLPELQVTLTRRSQWPRVLCLVGLVAFLVPVVAFLAGAAPNTTEVDGLRSTTPSIPVRAAEPAAPIRVATTTTAPAGPSDEDVALLLFLVAAAERDAAPASTAPPVTTTVPARKRTPAPDTTVPVTTTSPATAPLETPEPAEPPTVAAPSSAPSATATTKPAPAATTTTKPKPAPTTTAPKPKGTDRGQATWYAWKAGNCAHNTLPRGTVVTVTAVSTGRSTTCVVGDRGAFTRPTIIDLDKTVFEKIASTRAGRIDVVISW